MIAIRLMPERNCRRCTKQDEWGCTAKQYVKVDPETASPVLDRFGRPEMQWVNPARLPLDMDGEEWWACPRQDLKERPDAWGHMLNYYGMFRKGFLPQTGAVMDQSNYAVEVFRILDDANNEADDALQKADAEKQNRG